MARLEYPSPETLSEDTKNLLSMTADINIFRMMGHCETLITPFLTLGGAILTASKINPVLRELAIVRAATHCGSDYELRQHNAIALEVGVRPDQLDVLHDLQANLTDSLTEQEATVVTFADEMINKVKVSDVTFEKTRKFLSPCEIQELIIAIGYYSMVGRFLETLMVDLETGDDVKVVEISKIRKSDQ